MKEFNIKTKTSGKCKVYPDSPNGPQPSVTSICGALMKYGLVQWSADCAVDYIIHESTWGHHDENVPEDDWYIIKCEYEQLLNARHAHEQIKDDAAGFGTFAHLLCQLYLEGKDYQSELDKMREIDKPVYQKAGQLLESFITWAENNKIEPVHTEIVLHGDGYSGRCDLIAYRTCPKTGERRLGSYDIKTGKGSYYEEWKLQISAYWMAAEDLFRGRPEYKHLLDEWEEKGEFHSVIEEIGIIKLNKETLKCNFKAFTEDKYRMCRSWKHLVKFYWYFNDLESQFKDIQNAKTEQQ